MISLRPYQHTLREDIRAAFAAGHRQVLAVSPTGSGKSLLFIDMAIRAINAGRRVCIMLPRVELVHQVCKALGDFPHGVIRSGVTPIRHLPLQIASVQSLLRRTHLYEFDFLIVDETHHATSNTFMQILQAYPAAHVLGVTATPCRTDGRGLRDAGFTALVQGPTVRWLTDAGYLSPARVYAPGGLDVSGVKRGTEFNRGELEEVTDRPVITGNAIEHYRRYADRQPAIAFCVSVAHAEHVALGFREAGYSAAAIDGKKTDSERARLIGALASGALHVLTSCDLISEGVDVPVVSAGIMLRPTQSRALWMQQMGRCLRSAPGKTHATILDHAGNSRRLGCLPDTEHVWSLDAPPAPRRSDADPDAVTTWRARCARTAGMSTPSSAGRWTRWRANWNCLTQPMRRLGGRRRNGSAGHWRITRNWVLSAGINPAGRGTGGQTQGRIRPRQRRQHENDSVRRVRMRYYRPPQKPAVLPDLWLRSQESPSAQV